MAVSSHGNQGGGRLPRGPHGLEPNQVEADQRQRLIDAMVRLAGERGYAATTVADIIGLAQVSRKTFYAHFADRDKLLLAAFDSAASIALEEARAAARRTGGSTRQFEAVMRRLCRVAQDTPGVIALCTIEIAAHADGLTRRDRLMVDYGDLIAECTSSNRERLHELPPALTRVSAGGAHRMIDACLRSGRLDELSTLPPQLGRWVRSYFPVPPQLASSRVAASGIAGDAPGRLAGGRAPGTLTLTPSSYQPPPMKRSSGSVYHSNRERILDAVARLTAAHGYTTLTARSIAEHADLSERAFLAHFKSSDDAFAAAVEIGHMKGQALVERARSSTSDWRTGVRHAIHTLLDFLSTEPYFTRLAFVDAPLAGPVMARRTHEHANAYGRLLLDGAPQRRKPPPIAPEAVVHGLFELAFYHAASGKVKELSHTAREASYLALAPFLGVSEAAEVASE